MTASWLATRGLNEELASTKPSPGGAGEWRASLLPSLPRRRPLRPISEGCIAFLTSGVWPIVERMLSFMMYSRFQLDNEFVLA